MNRKARKAEYPSTPKRAAEEADQASTENAPDLENGEVTHVAAACKRKIRV